MNGYRLGVDIGGTFTDFALLDEATGRLAILKLPSTPERPSSAVVAGTDELLRRHGLAPATVRLFVHGTTLAVNTVIERSGARAGLLVTRGFRDILTIARHRIPDIFDFFTEVPAPLVPRSRVAEIAERTLADGRVLRAPDEDELRAVVGRLVAGGVEAIALCFLHSYQNPSNEERARKVIEEAYPDLYLSVSSAVWPQMREYERALVAVINAYVGPRMGPYFRALQADLEALGVRCPVLSTRSNGGVMSARRAGRSPVETLLSGPASGVIGAAYLGRLAGMERLITLDMGGTSADVGVVEGEPHLSTDSHVGDFPVILPAVDVSSIGAGGGSVAWTDAEGVLKVGPRSAGARPGPACYGLGGSEPTVTDAYVALGILDPERFLGGRMRLQASLARAALARVGGALGLEPEGAAEAILNVATAQMYAALVPLMARKGVDLADHALLAFGGAGPTHAFLLAQEVGIRRVLVPPHPGVLCAIGCLVADAKGDFVRTVYRSLPRAGGAAILAELARGFDELEHEARAWLEAEAIPVSEIAVVRGADMRYLGQSFEIPVPIGAGSPDLEDDGTALRAAFHRAYSQIYGYTDPEADLEVINIRLTVVGRAPKPALASPAGSGEAGGHPPAARTTRPVRWAGRWQAAAVYPRERLAPGATFPGPAVVEQFDSTVFIPEGFAVRVDAVGNLLGGRVDGDR
jgi:N-methylhydantoinase A